MMVWLFRRMSALTRQYSRVGGLICSTVVSHSTADAISAGNIVGNSAHLPVVLPSTRIARKIISPVDTSGLSLRLYQYQTCPFCCKVRTFLDYYGFSYEVVEVNAITRRQTKFTTYRKVPILIVQALKNKQLNDSSVIISALRTFTINPRLDLDWIESQYPAVTRLGKDGKEETVIENKYFLVADDPKHAADKYWIGNKREEREYRQWADDVLVHTLSPNVYRTMSESLESFRWFSEIGNWRENFPTWERIVVVYLGATAMHFISKRLKKRHNLKDDVRLSLYEACNDWTKAVGEHRRFMGGAKPNLADLAVYGVLSSIEGCSAFKDVLANTKIGTWFYATKQSVENREGSSEFANALKAARK